MPGTRKNTIGRNRKLENMRSLEVVLTRMLTLRERMRSSWSVQSRWAGISTTRARMISAL